MINFIRPVVKAFQRFQIKRNGQDNSLSAIVQKAIAQSSVQSQILVLDFCVVVHVPETVLDEAQGIFEELSQSFGGAYYPRDERKMLVGDWKSPDGLNPPEKIVPLTSYTTQQALTENLASILKKAHEFGHNLANQEAVAVEVFSPIGNILIIVLTK